MRLKLVRVQGYKRFAVRSALDTRGPVVAIVGPNEAGKTSLLTAITHLSEYRPIDTTELTDRKRAEPDAHLIQGHYSLDAYDRQALGDLLPPDVELTYERTIYPDGNPRYWMTPPQTRDLGPRRLAYQVLESSLADGWVLTLGSEAEGDEGPHAEPLRALLRGIGTDDETLPREVVQQLSELGAALQEGVPDEVRGDVDVPRTELPHVLLLAAASEAADPPHRKIHEVLSHRTPAILLFDQAARSLETEYRWDAHPEPPPALHNLFALSDTDFQAFRSAAIADDRATLEELQEAANRNLEDAFRAWRQDELHVSFSADKESIQLLIRDRATSRRNRLDERSDGLRTFVALIAFTARYGGEIPPVLLIDEAETHLHYAAQADLVRVFERQRVAQTVIYTTHSIGCLPNDLGSAIRAVSPTGQHNRSKVHNSFWSANGTAGLTPMMLAMGATALAFTASRRAVIAEGPSDAILLPSLIREAFPEADREDPLGYQVAPGIADIDPDSAAELELEAAGVAYLVDSDKGGRGHRRKLSQRAKDEGRVIELGEGDDDGLSIEDLVDADVLADAYSRQITRLNKNDRISGSDLPTVGRASFLAEELDKRGGRLNKTELARDALEIARHRGRLGDASRAAQLRALHARLTAAVEIT